MTAAEHFETSSKKGRGLGRRALELIEELRTTVAAIQPVTGPGGGSKRCTVGLIRSRARKEVQRVYRVLKEARERELIPWDWIVDETRAVERTSTWDNPAHYARCVAQSYRRDFWN